MSWWNRKPVNAGGVFVAMPEPKRIALTTLAERWGFDDLNAAKKYADRVVGDQDRHIYGGWYITPSNARCGYLEDRVRRHEENMPKASPVTEEAPNAAS